MKYAINCSIMYTELPLLERPQAAKADGFAAVEFWWPWTTAYPSDQEVAAFVAAIKDAGVQLIGLNFFAGDMPGGERGLVSVPHRVAEFRASVATAVAIGKETGCRAFNALYGLSGGDTDKEARTGIENLVFAGKAVAEIGGTVLLEPVSGADAYPLKLASDVIAVLDAVAGQVDNVGFLCDLYHLTANGDDLPAAIQAYGARAAHVQIADAPGRGEPGTGKLDLAGLLTQLKSQGYDGWVALEYKPTVVTSQSYGALPTLP